MIKKRNFLHQNSAHKSIFKSTLFIRSLATTARKNNIGETGMSRTVPKDLTSQIMLGRTIILLTLRMQLLLTEATIVCVKLLNHMAYCNNNERGKQL